MKTYDEVYENIEDKELAERRYLLLVIIVGFALFLGIMLNNMHLVNHAPVFIIP